ncbi:MAG: 50S ribosomal protein L10 [Bacteroidales bacterium]|jgi:large subunit ribosomal protein L10|nr:50S ribosomal protein L10 [Bacteroidales bacterium]MDD4002408.1 50S ribosomal protein L10 [Bacteroidales bacterium]MDD4528461.1 50S ribosomal protein L10 [Bacteroidales bacterium]MDD4828871.1 50S ribosomal protein L10 [Bacteroidales bacterium]
MIKEDKGQIIESIGVELSNYPYVYLVDIAGLNSVDTSKLRRLCFRREIKLLTVKNTLLRKAMEKSGIDYSEIFPALNGSTSIMLSNVNNGPAKLIKDFRGSSPKPLLKAAYVEEAFYLGDTNLDILINIKSKKELIADIIAALESPAKNVIGALQSGGNTLSGVLKTLSEKAE